MNIRKRLDSSGYFGLLVTIILALFFIFHTFSLAFIDGRSGFWASKGNDLVQHLSGLNMYLSCEWKFPLLAFDSLNYPEGTRVTFVDGIPLFAFLLKIFLPHNHGYISPFGYWLGFSFLFQGISAWWIARELEVKSWFFLIFLTSTFLTYPALMDRLRHIALMSQWIILFAIALYLRGGRLRHLSISGWAALLFVSFYIHVYFFAMVLGIYIAAALEAKHEITGQYIFSLFLPLIILGASLFLFLLPLPLGLKPEVGFDTLAMNLLSPVYGGKVIQLQADLSHHLSGFNYLGLGVILLFTWAFFSHSSKNSNIIRERWGFTFVMTLYFIYSLSDKIYFGGHLVAIVNYADFLSPITTQLRASGRFFWPVGYAIIIFSLYKLYYHIANKKIFSFVICALLAIQLSDISDYYKSLKTVGHVLPRPFKESFNFGDMLGENERYIYLYPTLIDSQYTIKVVMPMMQYSAMHKLKLNTGFIARYGIYNNDIATEIAHSSKKESIYAFSKVFYKSMSQVYQIVGDRKKVVCSEFDAFYVCHFKLLGGYE